MQNNSEHQKGKCKLIPVLVTETRLDSPESSVRAGKFNFQNKKLNEQFFVYFDLESQFSSSNHVKSIKYWILT
jgi:hypothetical protein